MRKTLRACGNAALTAVILAHLAKGPGHAPIDWLLNDALMFAAGARTVFAYLTWHEKKTDRTS